MVKEIINQKKSKDNSVTKKAGIIDKHIGNKIKFKRIQFGISQKKLGEYLGVTFQQIQKYENGSNRISIGRLYKMAKIFGVSVDWFVEDIEA